MSVAAFTNPATGTMYRLIVANGSWRVTRSREDEGQVRLAHLRGAVGEAGPDHAAVTALVAGKGGASSAANPATAFALVVLTDLERTADLLIAIARQAGDVCQAGCPGFRPHSLPLRQQRDRTLAAAASGAREMASAWRAAGLVAERPLPEWLATGMGDEVGAPATH